MGKKRPEIMSLNETDLAEISIDELEARLKMENLNRVEMWGGCSIDFDDPPCPLPFGYCVYEPGCWPWCDFP